MKRYLAWKQAELESPSVACAAPAPAFFQPSSPASVPFTSLIPGLPSGSATAAAVEAAFPSFSASLTGALSRLAAGAAELASRAAAAGGDDGVPASSSTPVASPLGLLSADVSAAALSPGTATLSAFTGPSAFSVVASTQPSPSPLSVTSPLLATNGALTAALYPQLMCNLPGLLGELRNNLAAASAAASTAAILRAPMTTAAAPPAPYKPIPNNDYGRGLDIVGWKLRDVAEWSADDVVNWMLDTSRKRNIPFEDVNMTKFCGLPGKTLIGLAENDWVLNDPVYGKVFYAEFRSFLAGESGTTLDDLIRNMHNEERLHAPSSSTTCLPSTSACMGGPGPSGGSLHVPPPMISAPGMNPGMASAQIAQVAATNLLRMQAQQSLASTLSAALSPSMGLNQLQGLSPQSPLLSQLQPKSPAFQPSPLTSTDMLLNKYGALTPQALNIHAPQSNCGLDYDSDDSALHGVNDKVRKSKDGKPRKRSQHSKGNKLWEFIRDALKDPLTCPSVVRWEDPHEGVFRIVESEKLARLWGDRKNNQKMTYEKLSRAMRYYYNTKILLPVSGRRLVYKFGPSARGWNCEGGPVGSALYDTYAHLTSRYDTDEEEEDFHHHAPPPMPLPPVSLTAYHV